jgi:4-amino-4-deoxy-L-arabinose transferase-like glycosyltransferase
MAVSSVQEIGRPAAGVLVRQRALLMAVAITCLAAVLRLYHVGANGLSNDESWSVWMSGQSVIGIVRTILFQSVDATPPTYYVLQHLALSLGSGLLAIRLVSIVAGTLIVWLTFQLAALLFDLRVAALSAALLAIAPMQITYAQVARAYMLTALLALLSLYLFARLLFCQHGRWAWVWFVAATAAALYTFYLACLVVLFENAFVAALWLRRRLARRTLRAWLISQMALVLLALPTSLSVAFALSLSHGRAGYGLTWLSRPGPQTLIKTAILFTTGDPSYGSSSVTPARVCSLAIVCGLAALGTWAFLRRASLVAGERTRVLFLSAAVVVPGASAFVVSQFRPIYHEKYLLFLMPPLFVLIAWAIMRARNTCAGTVLLVALLALTGSALVVYYTEPDGEQWREATAYVRAAYQPGDLIIVSPGFYGRPFSYYFAGSFPANIHALDHVPAIAVNAGTARLLDDSARDSTRAGRVWLISGYSPIDPATETWLKNSFTPHIDKAFVGVSVRMLERGD